MTNYLLLLLKSDNAVFIHQLSVSKAHSAEFIKKCITESMACHVIV